MHYLWAGLGLFCVALAMVGVVLPLLPTVPFLLLAAFFFARSSSRLHTWLLTHQTVRTVDTRLAKLWCYTACGKKGGNCFRRRRFWSLNLDVRPGFRFGHSSRCPGRCIGLYLDAA